MHSRQAGHLKGNVSAGVHKSSLQQCAVSVAMCATSGFAYRNELDGNCQADTNSSAGTDDQEDDSSGSDVYQQAESSRQPSVAIHASKRAKTGADALSCHAAAAQAGPSTAAQACPNLTTNSSMPQTLPDAVANRSAFQQPADIVHQQQQKQQLDQQQDKRQDAAVQMLSQAAPSQVSKGAAAEPLAQQGRCLQPLVQQMPATGVTQHNEPTGSLQKLQADQQSFRVLLQRSAGGLSQADSQQPGCTASQLAFGGPAMHVQQERLIAHLLQHHQVAKAVAAVQQQQQQVVIAAHKLRQDAISVHKQQGLIEDYMNQQQQRYVQPQPCSDGAKQITAAGQAVIAALAMQPPFNNKENVS